MPSPLPDASSSLADRLRQLGPGFLQSACTLGGASLAACLFLGSFAGLAAMWVQPVAMLLGLGVLWMISSVTLGTGQNPFQLINQRVSPVLGWGWLIATIAANLVWGLPQYNLGVDALTELVLPGTLGAGTALGGESGTVGRVVAVGIMAGVATGVTLLRLRPGDAGGRLFDRVIQLVVAGIVLCFGVVVIRLLISGGLSIGGIARGLIPSPGLLLSPAPGYDGLLAASGDAGFWSERLVSAQRNTVLAAISAAVGINMTFLMPYALLARGWGKAQRGLAGLDLTVGLLIPFVLVTGFVIAAAAATLHGEENLNPALVEHRFVEPVGPAPQGLSSFEANLSAWAAQAAAGWAEADASGRAALLDAAPLAERRIAAATVTHGTAALAAPLQGLFPGNSGGVVFGVGIFFITLSTVLVHMLINGYAMEAGFGLPRAVGSLLPLLAVFGPFVWGELGAYLVVPTALIGLMLLPLALWGFLFLGSQKSLGDARLGPGMRATGLFVTVVYTALSAWAAWGKVGWVGPALLVAVAVAALLTRPKAGSLPPLAEPGS